MDDTETPDPILQQVPLIKNPAYQPPKPIALNTNYNKLIPTLPSVRPPQINLSEPDLDQWISSIEELKQQIDKSEQRLRHQRDAFESWVGSQQRKVAPGFTFDGVMMPVQATGGHETPAPQDASSDSKHSDSVNEIDRLFGKVSI